VLSQNAPILSTTPLFGLLKTAVNVGSRFAEGGQSMQRKPDLLWILVILFGLGVVTTGYAQSLWAAKPDAPVEITQQQQQHVPRH
jgi:hypothetical protein